MTDAPPPSSALLDLVLRYGDAREKYAEILHTRGSEEGLDRYAAPMNNLFERIAALVPQQLVQARDGHTLWWQHHCGHVMGVHDVRQPDEDECPACLPDERHGPWRPLLVGGEPRPEPVQARDEFGTIWQHSCGMTGYGPGGSCPGNCGELGPWRPLFDAPGDAPAPERETPWCQHCGMLRAAPGHPFCSRCQYNFVPQEPMDALSERLHHEAVTSSTPSDVPVLIFRSASGRTEVARRDATAVLKGGFSINVLHGFDRLTSDEARRLGSKLAAKPTATLNDDPATWNTLTVRPGERLDTQTVEQVNELDRLRTAVIDAGKLVDSAQTDRNELGCLLTEVMTELGVTRFEDVLDGVRVQIKAVANNHELATIWRNQCDEARRTLERLRAERDEARAEVERLTRSIVARAVERVAERRKSTQPDPLVLRLPEVPEGTVALVGVASLRRYILSGMHHAQWKVLGSTWIGGLTAVLTNEHPDGVRVELAPSREPRTWPRIKITAGADLPAVVDVEGHGRWTLDSQLYGKPGHPHLVLLTTLRGMGSVTEVLDEPDGGTA